MGSERLEEGLLLPRSSLEEPNSLSPVFNGIDDEIGGDSSATPVVVFSTLVAICGSFCTGCGDFVEDTLLKIQRGMEECLYKGSNETSSALICYPGSEIPNWFEFQSTGSFIAMELSPGWFNNKFAGFALCIIVSIREHLQKWTGLAVGCECKLQSEDGREHVIDGTLWGWPLNGPERIGSDHLFLGCDYQMYPHDIGVSCYTNVISLYFHLKDTNYSKCVEFCEVIKCGVRLIYVQPEGSFRSNDDDEFWESIEKLSGSIGASVDDDDEFFESMERFSASFSSDDEDDIPHPNNGISMRENPIQGKSELRVLEG